MPNSIGFMGRSTPPFLLKGEKICGKCGRGYRVALEKDGYKICPKCGKKIGKIKP